MSWQPFLCAFYTSALLRDIARKASSALAVNLRNSFALLLLALFEPLFGGLAQHVSKPRKRTASGNEQAETNPHQQAGRKSRRPYDRSPAAHGLGRFLGGGAVTSDHVAVQSARRRRILRGARRWLKNLRIVRAQVIE